MLTLILFQKIKMNRLFKKLYFDPQTGFSGLEQLYERAVKINPKIKKPVVKKWLEKQPTYTLHKPARRKYTRNKVLVSGIDEQWQADLVDLQSLSKHNEGFKYLLTCIDIFSKFAWSIPLKSKTSKHVLEAFQKILDSGRKPYYLQTDAGKEFENKHFQSFLKSNFINFFTTNSELKASVVERFNRTLKEKMWRYFTMSNTYKYIDILDALMANYNHSHHRTIGTFPANVSHKNENEILNKAFRIDSDSVDFKFNIGDKVRVSKVKKPFEKGYWPNWSEEYFIIESRFARTPTVYTLKDQMGEKLQGVFYETELQKIDPSTNDLHVVEKVIKTRKRGKKTDYLVHWRGYPSKFDSWVSKLVTL